jgi:hypothetical protein
MGGTRGLGITDALRRDSGDTAHLCACLGRIPRRPGVAAGVCDDSVLTCSEA